MNRQPLQALAELRQAHKRFGAMHALKGVDLQLRGGELDGGCDSSLRAVDSACRRNCA